MRAILFAIGFLSCLNLFGQEIQKDTRSQKMWEAGLPFITTYTPEDYKAAAQNWSFIQDNRGIMYVGNSAGILEFDGSSWHLIKLPKGGRVNSLAKRNDGVIFVGASKDLGYMHLDSVDQVQFVSLLPHLDTAFHNFSDVWHTFAIQDTIYFVTAKYIFQWANNSFKMLSPKNIFGFAFCVRDKIYVDDRGTGIMQLKDDSLELISDGSMFSRGGVTVMSPYGQEGILIIHALEGAYLYDQDQIIPFKNKLIQNSQTYGSIILPNGDRLIYSIGAGAYSVDDHGKLKQLFNKRRGLTSDVIYGAYIDNQGGLWLACDNGINRLEISSPIRIFDDRNGITATVQKSLMTDRGCYVSTNIGLFHYSHDKLGFQPVNGISNMTRDLVKANDGVLVGNLNALYHVDHYNQSRVIKFGGDSYNTILRSSIDSSKVYVAGNSGNLYELIPSAHRWKLGKPVLSVDGKIMQILEGPDSSLWLNTRFNGVFRVNRTFYKEDEYLNKEYQITHFNKDDGLPILSDNYLYLVNNQLYLSTQVGLYLYDIKNQKFGPDTLLMNQISFEDISTGPFISSERDSWLAIKSDFQNKVYQIRNGIVNEMKLSRRFSDYEIYDIYNPETDVLFFTGLKGIIAYNTAFDPIEQTSFPIHIRKVLIETDSLIWSEPLNTEKSDRKELPFQKSTMRFTYALPGYDKPEANQYQYYLEGFNESWSSWSTETQREFTNLTEGNYSFRVRGKNAYGQISDEAVYAFTILPPLHRTWWAYLFYILAGSGMVLLIVRWRSDQLKKEKVALEKIVVERTRQLAGQAEQLEHQAEQLKEMDQQKSRFFANISHEFRTPLTLIKGPADNALQTQKGFLPKEDTLVIRNNANRLLRLVNQLLDLSKLDAKKMILSPTSGDICQFLRAVGSAFSSHAEQRNIEYVVNVPEKKFYTSFDHDKLEKILYNLLSNAFKFCADKGKVVFTADCSDGQLITEVSDNGVGIPEKQLSYIFDRFYQTDDSHTREYGGVGIGLALSKELIILMGGTIQVKSELGNGTKFTVTIPMEEVPGSYVEKVEEKYPQPLSIETDNTLIKNIEHLNEESKIDAPIILIVEDNRDMRDFIGKQLMEGYKIQEAANGKSGLNKAQTEIPDLIITDLMMPKMDGIELCRQLKTDERTSHIPIIMLTAKAGQEHKIEGLEIGADDYVVKPFDKKELRARVKNLIIQREQLRKRFSRQVMLEPRKIAITSMDEQFLNKVMALLEENLPDEDFGVPKMQDVLAMSKTQLHRKMKALTDQAPGEFIRHYRLQRAAQILSEHGGNVTEVAFAVGFGSLSYFTRCFKEFYHQSPSEYAAQKNKL